MSNFLFNIINVPILRSKCFCNFARMDFRKQWFQNSILNCLGETDPELMNIFLSRNDNDMGHKFDSFLNDNAKSVINLWNQVFVVYKTYYSKMVEEEIEVQEEGNYSFLAGQKYSLTIRQIL